MRAAQALAVAAWARAIKRDRSATADLETACAVMESADDRDILIGSMTALGMVLSSSDLPRSLVLRERSLAMARAEGLVYIESWTVTMICHTHLHGGALDEALRYADDLASMGERTNNDDAVAFALHVHANVKVARGDLAAARTLFADAVARARGRSSAWPRTMALFGRARVTVAARPTCAPSPDP